jgi:predicted GTPase
VNQRPAAVGELREVFKRYPHIGPVLPAIGYTAAQREALAETIRCAAADVVVSATAADLVRLITIDMLIVRARSEFAEPGEPCPGPLLDTWLAAHAPR